MGGAVVPVRHRGRLRRAERNFSQDPAAAAMVLASTDTTVVPLDVTVAMRLEPDAARRLLGLAPELVPEVERWIAEQDEPIVLHDPLALLVGSANRTCRSSRAACGWTRPTAPCAKARQAGSTRSS